MGGTVCAVTDNEETLLEKPICVCDKLSRKNTSKSFSIFVQDFLKLISLYVPYFALSCDMVTFKSRRTSAANKLMNCFWFLWYSNDGTNEMHKQTRCSEMQGKRFLSQQ